MVKPNATLAPNPYKSRYQEIKKNKERPVIDDATGRRLYPAIPISEKMKRLRRRAKEA